MGAADLSRGGGRRHAKNGGSAARAVEQAAEYLFFAAAMASVLSVAAICLFLAAGGLPAMAATGFVEFVFGRRWRPSEGAYGILPMLLASLWVTAGAAALGLPVGILTAVFMARFCPGWLYRLLKPAVGILAGVPSVIYGFFGLTVIVPLIRRLFWRHGASGGSMLAAVIILAVMILPTVISAAEAAIAAAPEGCYHGALALGATRERGVFFALLPAARQGIASAAALGLGRAIGETTAVMMISGNQARMPAGLFKGIRTLTANIAMEIGYAADLHRGALVAAGAVLLLLILAMNAIFSLLEDDEQ